MRVTSERNEVSRHEVAVFQVVRTATEWLTSAEIARRAEVASRTARSHAKKLSDLGLIETAEVFPGHRYRWCEKASKRNAGYLRRLEQAAEVFQGGAS